MDEVFVGLQVAFMGFGGSEVNLAECSDGFKALWCLQSTDLGLIVALEVELMVTKVFVLLVSFQSEIPRIAPCSEGYNLLGSINGREESVNDTVKGCSPDICASLG